MKDNKVKIFASFLIIAVVAVTIGYFVFNREDKKTNLSLTDRQWIEKNKNNIFDINILNEIPIFNLNNNGVYFDFLAALEKDTGINFNKNAHFAGTEINDEYALTVDGTVTDKDILFYKDTAVLIMKEKRYFRKAKSITNLTIGVLKDELDDITKYLSDSRNINFKTYDDYEALYKALETDNADAIIAPKIETLNDILEGSNYNIVYHLDEFKYNYILRLGKDEKLNEILTKYTNNWKKQNYNQSFHENLLKNYFYFKETEDKERVSFLSNTYNYGFTNNNAFDLKQNKKNYGLNHKIISNFKDNFNLDLNYKEYETTEQLIEALDKKEIDFHFNISLNTEYNEEIKKSISIASRELAVMSDLNNELALESLEGLSDYSVICLKGTTSETMLSRSEITYNAYETFEELKEKIKEDSIIVADKETYEYLQRREFKNLKLDYKLELNESYDFVIVDNNKTKLFSNLFDFYLSFINPKFINNASLAELLNIKAESTSFNKVLILSTLLLGIAGLVFAFIHYKPKLNSRKRIFSKEDKIRYIDSLTSLKNRTYLNDITAEWDNTNVYPQTVVIIDLKNIAYINDNFGHSEGDETIIEAANIIINTQLPNSEIIRTSGNEFLVYLIGYEEKEIKVYLSSLDKKYKELKHGFGAASGYSMIQDEIKTIDDAINEASIDMRKNKEGL